MAACRVTAEPGGDLLTPLPCPRARGQIATGWKSAGSRHGTKVTAWAGGTGAQLPPGLPAHHPRRRLHELKVRFGAHRLRF